MPLSNEFARALFIKARDKKARELAIRLSEIAQSIHSTAPRDSVNTNSKGQKRSSSLAAPDTGNLLSLMQQAPRPTEKGFLVTLNYGVLENGPLKRQIRKLAQEQLKRERKR